MSKVRELKKNTDSAVHPDGKVTLAKGVIREIWNGIARIANLTGVKFLYTVNYNREKLKGINKALDEAAAPNAGYKEFQQEYAKLRREYQDETKAAPPGGEPVIDPERADEYRAKSKALETKYQSALDNRQKQRDDFNELLNETEEVEFRLIPLSRVPKEATGGQVQYLHPMLFDDLAEDGW